MADKPYSVLGDAQTDDPALALRIEQDGSNHMWGVMPPEEIPALLRKIASNIEAQLGHSSETLTVPPCHCGKPIPRERVAYCSDRCRWDDDRHEGREADGEVSL